MPTYPLGSYDSTPNFNVSLSGNATDKTDFLKPTYNVSGKNQNLNITNSDPDTQKNIASSKNVNSGIKKELTEAEYKKEYIREAQKIALYRDPPAFPFISSRGEGNDRVTVLPSAQLRVFIMGIEVSAWLTNTSLSSDASPGVIASSNSFIIQCPTDLFTLTHDNVFLDQWNLNDDFRASEQVKQSLYTQKKNKNVYEQKTLVGTWSLTVNTCIFHSSDTVRIFSHLPWTEDDAWLPVFNGYIADVSVNSDLLTGRDTINITLETISSKLNKWFTNRPATIKAGLGENLFIPFKTNTAITFKVDTYNYSNVLINNYVDSSGLTTAAGYVQCNIGSAAINTLFGSSVVNDGVKYYDVWFNSLDKIRVYLECNPKYNAYNLHFINQWGMYDTARFDLVSKLTMDIERKTFMQRDYSCLLYTSPSPRDRQKSRMPSSA